MSRNGYFHSVPAEKLVVPNQEPLPFSPESSKLTVPNQDVPPGDNLRGNGFVPGRENLFRLSDGTVLDVDSGKIVVSPRSEKEYWGDPNRSIGPNRVDSFGATREPTLDELVSDPEKYLPGSEEPPDPRSVAYWKKAEIESAKMKEKLTDELKSDIEEFEKHFPKSKFVDESVEIENQKEKKETKK